MSKRIAVVGATGAVGTIVRELLEHREFEYDSVKFLASKRSAGKQISFADQTCVVELLEPNAFHDVDVVIGSTPDDVALEFAPWVVAAGAILVDESGAHRMLEHVPLVVPEVNPEALENHQGIIASPNCSTTQMVLALKPLHDAATVRRVIVSTYQATSGAGLVGNTDLLQGTRAALQDQSWDYQIFQHPIAFNVIPQIGSSKHEGYTSEEMKMVWETRKILSAPRVAGCPTCVRVPVTNCHSESIVVETEKPIAPEQARELFSQTPGITVVDNLPNSEYPMPSNSDNQDDVFVGRIRTDISRENSLAFWCVSDNLRKGAATNAVQIAEMLLSDKLSKCVS